MKRIFTSAAIWRFTLACTFLAFAQGVAAAQTFEPFAGQWEGVGTIRFGDSAKERLRCTAKYDLANSSGRELMLAFDCKSDTYAFVLDGRVLADSNGTISGQWSETSRNVGGTAMGKVEGERFRVRIESSGFGANLLVGIQKDRQKVSIKSGGGGEEAEAQITLKKRP